MKIKWNMVWKKAAAGLAFGIIGMMGFYQYRQEHLAEALSEKIIRFHVLANSDSEADQELKLKVRDSVGAYLKTELQDADGVGESRAIIRRDLDKIEETAEAVIAAEGYSYGVTATLGQTDFPVKTYGAYTFPAGEYEALNVTIGDGGGKNWWCVVYPNMCFQGSVYEVVDEEAEESLRQVLSEEEYEAVMESGEYEVEFKLLSFLNEL